MSANERTTEMAPHYQHTKAQQHWDRMWDMYREAWFVGNITKYVERYRSKNGMADLKKAQHYLEKLIEKEGGLVTKTTTSALWELIRFYVDRGATHRTKGWKLATLDNGFILDYAKEEMQELRNAPDDIDEMADVVGCLIHYCLRQGWSPEDIYNSLENKLRLRFDIKE